MKLKISKAFSSSVERTPRVLDIAEAFGLGLSDKQFVVFSDFDVQIEQGDVVYITGQSGSGKSLLLREIASQLAASGKKVANLDQVSLEERPLIDQIGKTTSEAVELMNRAGVGDAYLFIRNPSHLSDGQRYRMRLAKLIEGGEADVWVADEFGAVLDRVTAKVIAFNLQKLARALGKTLIVATTHTDLAAELGPSVVITKRYGDRVDLRYESDDGS